MLGLCLREISSCFEQGVPWHSRNYRVWIHAHRWHDKNIQLEIPSITFFGVSQEEMVNARVDLEDSFTKSKRKTEPKTRSSHCFVLISCKKIAHKLASEDRVSSSWFRQIIDRRNRYKKRQVLFVCQLYLWYILLGWHIDWSKCTWKLYENWISSPTWT